MTTPIERWVEEQAKIAQPDKIYWCDGSEEEAQKLLEIGMKKEKIDDHPVFQELNQKEWPGAYFHRSHHTDVARTEHLTYVCHPEQKTAGPNNNWMDPKEAKQKLLHLSKGCMRGKTMYVLPYIMEHPNSPNSKACVQVTDVSYVCVSMRIMTRMGKVAMEKIGDTENFVKGFHSVGDFDPNKRFIMHFPDENLVWSIGSGYGGNALLGKKCFSLRIASCLGRQEGWLAEHMVVIGIEDPEGKITYVTAALPSACGKTNLAMLKSALPGYRVWTLGDDIAWLNVGPDGRLWAINPETGLFGVAPGTSMETNPNLLQALKKGTFFPTLFTNTALDADNNEPWWEGMDGPVPENIIDWRGNRWDGSSGTDAAHPNSRFTVSITHSPSLSPEFYKESGVPISAVIFGGRRAHLIPLVTESFDWQHGVFLGARMGSETTSAISHGIGKLRRDPMAMLPFCGYNMGDYFKHWLDIGKKLTNPPKIFSVNWFRTDDDGKFLWPGFRENIRVLEWIIDRTQGKVDARQTPIGLIPHIKDLNLDGLDMPVEKAEKMFEIDKEEWKTEAESVREFFGGFGENMPEELSGELKKLVSEL